MHLGPKRLRGNSNLNLYGWQGLLEMISEAAELRDKVTFHGIVSTFTVRETRSFNIAAGWSRRHLRTRKQCWHNCTW